MDTLEAIRQRRSVKHYDPQHVLSDAQLDDLLAHAILAPTSFNLQHWRFVVVRDRQVRQQLRAAAWNQAQVTDASVLIVLCADLRAWEKQPERYWRDAPAAARAALVPMIAPFYAGNETLQRDEAMRSVGLVAATLMIATKASGLDSSPMIGFDAQRVAEIIRLPEDHVIGMLLAIGKATQAAWPKPGQLPLSQVVIHDRF